MFKGTPLFETVKQIGPPGILRSISDLGVPMVGNQSFPSDCFGSARDPPSTEIGRKSDRKTEEAEAPAWHYAVGETEFWQG